MNNKLKLLLFIISITFNCQYVFASELSAMIQTAIKHNYKIRTSEYEVISSEYDMKKELSPFFPSINASVNTKWNDSDTFDKNTNVTTQNSYNTNGYSISLSQNLIDFSKLKTYQIGVLNHEINQLKHHKVINDIIINVIESNFLYLKYHSQYIATESELTSSISRLKHITRNYELGNIAKTDVYEAYAKKQANEQKLSDIKKNIEITLLKLQSTIQRKITPSFDVNIIQNYQKISDQQQVDLKAHMFIYNYDIIISKRNTKKSIKSSEQSIATFYPTLSTSVNYQHTDSNNNPGTDTEDIIYSLDLSIPITNGGNDFYTYQKNKKKIEQSNIEYEQVINDNEVSFKELVYKINHNVTSIHTLKSIIVFNYSVYKGSKRAYKIGTKTLTDLLGAESNLYNSIRDFQANQYDYIINTSKLKALLGPLNLNEIDELSNAMIPLKDKFDITLLDQFKGVL